MIMHLAFAPLLQVADPQLPPISFFPWLIFALIKLLIVFTLYMVAAALLTLAERKLSAWIQDRHGPNRVGPWGLMQPLADGLKNLVKEEAAPSFASGALYTLAPIISFIPALITWAVAGGADAAARTATAATAARNRITGFGVMPASPR